LAGLGHKRSKLADINRFDEVIVSAPFYSFLAGVDCAVGGYKDYFRAVIVLFGFFEDGQSVNVATQFQVGNDDIDLLAAHNLKCIGAVVNGDRPRTEFFKRFCDSVGVVTLIVNYQDYAFFLSQNDTSL